MPIPPKITFCLLDLAAPLGVWCDEHGRTPSEAARIAIAAMLGVSPPEAREGNPNAVEHMRRINARRLKRKKLTRKKHDIK